MTNASQKAIYDQKEKEQLRDAIKELAEENNKFRDQIQDQTEKAIEDDYTYNGHEKKTTAQIEKLNTVLDY